MLWSGWATRMGNDRTNGHAGSYESSGEQDSISIRIENMLDNVHPFWSEHSIFRVCHQLREVDEKAYEPQILAIGPYHHGNEKFKFMEQQKLRYLRRLLDRNDWSIDRFMPTLILLEKQARRCYVETIDLSREDFLLMMLIDGCFIIELLRKNIEGEMGDRDDPILRSGGIRDSIYHDLLLLENQLPHFVLRKLYKLIKGPEEPLKLNDAITLYFQSQEGRSGFKTLDKGEHLLHLYHTWWTSGKPKTPQPNCIKLLFSATELRESGVRFKAAQECGLTSIKFENGTLEIPFLKVEDLTKSKLRNLIAYEQHQQSRDITYFTDYAKFMDRLINSSKDIEVLCRAGIVENYLGHDEVVAQMFNKMVDHVNVPSFGYSETCRGVKEYCTNSPNLTVKLRREVFKLRKEYFRNTWASLSVLAATVLLLLTAAQTVFSVLSYTKQS